jgi:hypothetical protein
MDMTLNISHLLRAYEQLNTLPPEQLVNTIFRELSVSQQAYLIQKRRKAPDLRTFRGDLDSVLQDEMDYHFTTLYKQYITITIN